MLFGRKLNLIKKPNKEVEEKLRKDIGDEGGLEKKDMPAMILSAYVVLFGPIFLVALLILIIVCLL